MTTTVQQVLDAALDRNLWNDSEILNLPRAIAWLDRLVKRFYSDASRPVNTQSTERNDYFATRTTLTLGSGFTDLPTAVKTATWLPPEILTAGGRRVRLSTSMELADGVAEAPPALIWEGRQVKSTGRSGDVASGDILTLIYTAAPGTLADVSHFIGASTVTDGTTSIWPDNPGTDVLAGMLASYLARKDDADPEELGALDAETSAGYAGFLKFVRGRL